MHNDDIFSLDFEEETDQIFGSTYEPLVEHRPPDINAFVLKALEGQAEILSTIYEQKSLLDQRIQQHAHTVAMKQQEWQDQEAMIGARILELHHEQLKLTQATNRLALSRRRLRQSKTRRLKRK